MEKKNHSGAAVLFLFLQTKNAQAIWISADHSCFHLYTIIHCLKNGVKDEKKKKKKAK